MNLTIAKCLKAFGVRGKKNTGTLLGRKSFRDIAYQFKLNSGFAGVVNRHMPFNVITKPVGTMSLYGQAGIIDATTKLPRPLAAGDTAIVDLLGITVRPYPYQQTVTDTMGSGNTNALNVGGGQQGISKASNVIDFLRSGFIQAPVVGTPGPGDPVFIWIAASTGNHVQGGFEAVTSVGNTIKLDGKTTFNGAPDANGIVEIGFNI